VTNSDNALQAFMSRSAQNDERSCTRDDDDDDDGDTEARKRPCQLDGGQSSDVERVV